MKVVRELLQDPSWVRNEMLEEAYYRSYHGLPEKFIYVHSSGEVLEVMPPRKTGRLYNSRAEFEQYLQWMREPHSPKHVLEGHMLYGKEFPEHLPQLIDDLAILLKIPRAELDGSLDSLLKVDSSIKKRGKRKCLEAPVFSAIVAYCGEVMCHQTYRQWEMRLDQFEQKTWEPWIVYPQQRSCNPFMSIYEDLAERHGFSIYNSVAMAIRWRRKLPSEQPKSNIVTANFQDLE